LIHYLTALDDSFTYETSLTVGKNSFPDLNEKYQNENGQKSENFRKIKDCLPVHHLAFLPMKRTKSFLLQAIFVHFGLKNHLRFAFGSEVTFGLGNF